MRYEFLLSKQVKTHRQKTKIDPILIQHFGWFIFLALEQHPEFWWCTLDTLCIASDEESNFWEILMSSFGY